MVSIPQNETPTAQADAGRRRAPGTNLDRNPVRR
jgi:hypothetical protein